MLYLITVDANHHLARHGCKQASAASACPCMPASVAENFNENIRAAVDDFPMTSEIRFAIHNAHDFDNLIHFIKIDVKIMAQGTEPPQTSISCKRLCLFG